MKTIQIRFLGPTNTRGTRLKVWARDLKPVTYSRDYEIEPYEQARLLASEYINHHGLHCEVYGFGSLPNGDYVATLGK